jgi:hypothetical protein
MKTIGLCTHFAESDEWALDFALEVVKRQGWQLTICHWLESPYSLRRDIVYPSLNKTGEPQSITPELLNQLELELRQYYEEKLGDFTNVAFKLCEGMYQVELTRCFRQHLLDLVVMGFPPTELATSNELPLKQFAAELEYPLVIIGPDRSDQYLLNSAAEAWVESLQLQNKSWRVINPAEPVHG